MLPMQNSWVSENSIPKPTETQAGTIDRYVFQLKYTHLAALSRISMKTMTTLLSKYCPHMIHVNLECVQKD